MEARRNRHMVNHHLKAVEHLQIHEGYRARPYKCSEDTWTIGYGTTRIYTRDLPVKEVNQQTAPMPKVEARWNLLIYLDKALDIAKTFVTNFDDLSPERQYCLAMMAYQLGYGLNQFHNTKYFIESEAWRQAADEMLDSEWRKQTPNRAREMAAIMRTGKWQNMNGRIK